MTDVHRMAAVDRKHAVLKESRSHEAWACDSLYANPEVAAKAAEFFNEHYGLWSDKGPRPGQPCKLSKRRILQEGDIVRVCNDEKNNRIAQMIFRDCQTEQLGHVVWVKQIVVHAAYRRRGLATFLLSTIVRVRYIALVTCNVYTVRALEKCAGSKVLGVSEIAQKLLVESNVNYLCAAHVRVMSPYAAVMTEFHVKPPKGSAEKLNNLQPGEEFLAVVQPQRYWLR